MEAVQVEFVSANPTGPLHVGHGRGAAYGASLSSLLDFAGYEVTREYYVNDAGRQMDILALSTWLRYLELFGIADSLPAQRLPGRLRARHGGRRSRRRTATASP
jgi:arginyl-tRNA synthetase